MYFRACSVSPSKVCFIRLFFLETGHVAECIWPHICKRPHTNHPYKVKYNTELQISLELCPKCELPYYLLELRWSEKTSSQNTVKDKAGKIALHHCASFCGHTIAILNRVKRQLKAVPLQPKKEHHIHFIVLSLIKTKPEVTQVIIVYKRSDTTKCSVPKQESKRIKDSFHPCRISHA